MAQIQVTIDIKASQQKVWSLISALDDEPKFWKGTKKVRNISKEGNTIKREVIIAFRDQKCLQTVTIEPEKSIHVLFTKGIIQGTKTMVLRPSESSSQQDMPTTTLDVTWDIKLSGIMSMFTGMIKNHIKSGTQQAVNNIKKEIES